MSIAEKLTTVAENQQKVYDAGHNKAVELYCPEFMESGASVVCNPVGNYPLGVISYINPIQSGSGEPSPTNVRPITGHTAVTVYIQNENGMVEQTAQLEQNVYAGSFDWSTGLLTLTHKILTLTGEETCYTANGMVGWVQDGDSVRFYDCFEDAKKASNALSGWCSHAPTSVSSCTIEQDMIKKAWSGGEIYIAKPTLWGLPNGTVEEWTAYLKAQNAAGTPVQILYELETPITVQITPQEILALDGANTIYSDTGDTTVKGKRNPLDRFTPMVQTIPLGDLLFGCGAAQTYNSKYDAYVSERGNRIICPYFIPVDAGGTYRLDWEGDASVNIGIEGYNSKVTYLISDNQVFSVSDMMDYGWGTSGGKPYIVDIPKTINGKPAELIRVMFNAASGVTGDITITRIK